MTWEVITLNNAVDKELDALDATLRNKILQKKWVRHNLLLPAWKEGLNYQQLRQLSDMLMLLANILKLGLETQGNRNQS